MGNEQLELNWCQLLSARRYNIEDDDFLVVDLHAHHLQLQVGPGTEVLIKVKHSIFLIETMK